MPDFRQDPRFLEACSHKEYRMNQGAHRLVRPRLLKLDLFPVRFTDKPKCPLLEEESGRHLPDDWITVLADLK